VQQEQEWQPCIWVHKGQPPLGKLSEGWATPNQQPGPGLAMQQAKVLPRVLPKPKGVGPLAGTPGGPKAEGHKGNPTLLGGLVPAT